MNYISIAIRTLFELEVLFNPANQFGSISYCVYFFVADSAKVNLFNL